MTVIRDSDDSKSGNAVHSPFGLCPLPSSDV